MGSPTWVYGLDARVASSTSKVTRRLDIRAAFRALERRPRVYFYTTSSDKYLQARYVFNRCGLPLRQFRSKTDSYHETESHGTEVLLTEALDEIRASLGDSSLFFVEDTSVVIDALSDEGRDVPGLHVKEWFAKTRFADLDSDLRRSGRGRGARIYSDIALHIPGLARPAFFHGEVCGAVADSAPDFLANQQHPWLTPDTFNGWFIPEGTDRRLGEMSIEESLRYDFRVKALLDLIDRLEEYTAILNLPSAGYQTKPKPTRRAQTELFTTQRPAFLVIGPTCAGKTTFAEQAEQRELQHIEASTIVRSLGERASGENPAVFAARMLSEHGADVVARRILDWFEEVRLDSGFVISGFRTVEELLAIKEVKPGTQVVLVDADPRIRLERYLKRSRDGEPISIDELETIDDEQAAFGLLSVAHQLPDLQIRNEDSLESYYKIIDALVEGVNPNQVLGVSNGPSRSNAIERGQLERCLLILQEAGRPLSTGEIETRSSHAGSRIRHNNANKVLKRYPALVRRLEGGAGRLRYQILQAGQAYLRYLREFADKQDPNNFDDVGTQQK